MNTRRIGAALAGLALIAGSVLVIASPAAAHDKRAAVSCAEASVSLTNYDRGATALVVVDGVTQHDGTFNGRLVQSWPLTGNVEHSLKVSVESFDNVARDGSSPYDYEFDQTTTGCYTPPVEPVVVTAGFTATDAKCIDNAARGNSATLTLGEGVIADYSLNGIPQGSVSAGTYGDEIIVAGTYVITAHAPDGTEFEDGTTAQVFEHTFPAVPTDCEPIVVEPVMEHHEESTCTSTSTYSTRTWTTTDGVITADVTTSRDLTRAEAIDLGCYVPPVVECPDGSSPGWLNEFGDPTSCVDDDPCPTDDSPTCEPTPPTEPPTTPEGPHSLATTGSDPTVPSLVAGGLGLLGLLVAFGPWAARRIRAAL